MFKEVRGVLDAGTITAKPRKEPNVETVPFSVADSVILTLTEVRGRLGVESLCAEGELYIRIPAIQLRDLIATIV